MSKKSSAISKVYMAIIFAFLYAPIVVMTVFSFNSTTSTYQMEGLSLHWWEEMFKNSEAMTALKNTVVLAVITAAVSTVLGLAAAALVDRVMDAFHTIRLRKGDK